ncbi:MAG: DUF1722 domain-containing protein [Deltaproteobacteria bacterium]|nr:DUF1722 domain-containing protein [Deltaproteobacteria bacterium]MBN2688627.1 DUF1722 domain-containing protein [Deltaproteobacteria bacterium]
MRVWDIDAGFLNDKSLLGEHRELHAIVSIVRHNKRGYAGHPETLRWSRSLGSLAIRHDLLVEEMLLRGFNHHSPMVKSGETTAWPSVFIDEPDRQYRILQGKYVGKSPGRIPLPRTMHNLWASHKYSVMARDYAAYRDFGRLVAGGNIGIAELSQALVRVMRTSPPAGSLTNAIFHMWGYVSSFSSLSPTEVPLTALLREIQTLALANNVTYLLQSTALGELAYWCKH